MLVLINAAGTASPRKGVVKSVGRAEYLDPCVYRKLRAGNSKS